MYGIDISDDAKGMALKKNKKAAKDKTDAFTSGELISYLNSRNISEVELIGVDGNSCIKASAKGAMKNGFNVSVILSCIGIANFERFDRTKEQLEKIGVRFI